MAIPGYFSQPRWPWPTEAVWYHNTTHRKDLQGNRATSNRGMFARESFEIRARAQCTDTTATKSPSRCSLSLGTRELRQPISITFRLWRSALADLRRDTFTRRARLSAPHAFASRSVRRFDDSQRFLRSDAPILRRNQQGLCRALARRARRKGPHLSIPRRLRRAGARGHLRT